VPVFVYTNGDCAELFLNEKSVGKKCKNPKSEKSIERFRLMWNDVLYEPGVLKAVAYREGEQIGECVVRTAAEPYRLNLTPDRMSIRADGSDLSYILIEAFDKNGNICPLADNKIDIEINGAGEIAGIGNGNPQSMTFFRSHSVDLFYGKAMLIVRSKTAKGIADIKATSENLKDAKVAIKME
jgi:beta-galactosidase